MITANRRLDMYQTCLALTALSLLCFAVTSAQAATSALDALFPGVGKRPAAVSAEFVITPFGYFHPSCVLQLAEGNTLLADGRVQHPNGTIEAARRCQYPHYTSGGIAVPADVKPGDVSPLVISGWLESVSATTTTAYSKLTSTWVVPPEPTTDNGQLLYFFPGFEDIDNVISILQPVMQWGVGFAGGGPYWTAASWNCCINGTTWHSPLIDLNVGDTIVGTISSPCGPGPDCPIWNVVTNNKTTGEKTTLARSPVRGQVWNWVFGAVAEPYGVVECTDFPDNSGLTFTVRVYDENGDVTIPDWQEDQWIRNPDPQCDYGTTITPNRETVRY